MSENIERAERAKQLFSEGYNCCQAVVGAYADLFGIDEKTAVKLAEGMGAGMGRMRLTCGAVSGMALLAGLKLSQGEKGDLKTRGEIYSVIQQMANEFKEQNGSIICGELLSGKIPKDNSPIPEARTEEYYKKRPCPDCVKDCALLVEKYLLNKE